MNEKSGLFPRLAAAAQKAGVSFSQKGFHVDPYCVPGWPVPELGGPPLKTVTDILTSSCMTNCNALYWWLCLDHSQFLAGPEYNDTGRNGHVTVCTLLHELQ